MDNRELATLLMEAAILLNESMETFLTNPLLPKQVKLYHGSSKKLDIISPMSLNIGTRLSSSRMSSFWTTDINLAKLFAIHQVISEEFGNNSCTLKPLVNDDKIWIIKEKEKEIISLLKKSKYYIYDKVIDKKYIGRGHNSAIEEYTLDIKIKPDNVNILTYDDIKNLLVFKPEKEINELFNKFKSGKIGQSKKLIDKMIFYSYDKWSSKNRDIKKQSK